MVFSKGLSKNVFNCHPRNKTSEGALARDYNWQFKVTIVNLVTTAIPNREALPGFPVAWNSYEERDAKKTLGYHTLAFRHRERIKGIGGQVTVN